jgi:primosomal protein N' (replication factor Y)
MVAKGLNFPGVRLVGVVLADTGLHLPDFRAAERTFSLIVQVAGRAGRYFPDGKVIVQTFRPSEPAVALACAHDIDGFYRYELEQRKLLSFPPYARLIRVVFRSKDQAKAERSSRSMAAILRRGLDASAELLGPSECPIAVIAGNARRHLLLRAETLAPVHAALRRALAEYGEKPENGVYLEVDVDPVSLL